MLSAIGSFTAQRAPGHAPRANVKPAYLKFQGQSVIMLFATISEFLSTVLVILAMRSHHNNYKGSDVRTRC